MFRDYPLWQIIIIEMLILGVAGNHALLLSVYGNKRTQRVVNHTVNIFGMTAITVFIGFILLILSSLTTIWLLKALENQSEFNIKVVLEISVQLFGLMSLANILIPVIVKNLRTSAWLNVLAVILLVSGTCGGNLFKLYVNEKNFQGIGPVLSIVSFVTSFYAICALLAYAFWISRQGLRQPATQGEIP